MTILAADQAFLGLSADQMVLIGLGLCLLGLAGPVGYVFLSTRNMSRPRPKMPRWIFFFVLSLVAGMTLMSIFAH